MQVCSVIIFKRLTCEIEYSANHDTLTGLPSLRLAIEQLELVVSLAKRNKQKVALIFLDLDGFKQVNDTYGHDVGDEVLIQVSNRINTVIRQSDIACRLGGDEFIIILPGLGDASMVKQVAGQLVEKISEEIIIDKFNLQVGVSIGVAIYPDHATNTTELRKKADEVMYSIKRTGKNNFAIASK